MLYKGRVRWLLVFKSAAHKTHFAGIDEIEPKIWANEAWIK